MFTGIVEYTGEIRSVSEEGTNRIFDIWAPFTEEIYIDQSISHDGVCLTVTRILDKTDDGVLYSVTAVRETLMKTSLGIWKEGYLVNIERSMKMGSRIDGHFVQGHVDQTAKVEKVEEVGGSWMYEFSYEGNHKHLLVDKGSICVNGVSLTIVKAWDQFFSVTIIPYTYDYTNFKQLSTGDTINLEFDILGKYIAKLLDARFPA